MVDRRRRIPENLQLFAVIWTVLGLGLMLVHVVGCTPASGPCNDPNYVAGDPESPCHMSPWWGVHDPR
jgi:hypothetical protein